ncbi:hypothetical protein EMPS_04575 [Entomortierella parvispora]|uniref:Uncharacterized protein n=1 Tax=Entomortierella parvispora TaxID=205924 RepID=A0A9P3LVL2_9FUNG|nr:hypothetical protein EMPS_04575 [Entomortierella parvispora]
MSDSDDSKPAPPRKVQPKPRRRVVSRNRSDNSIGSSQDTDSTAAQPHARRRIEDDFFSKAKNFRDITKAQETIYMKESEPEIQESQLPELEPIAITDVIPVFDFEDEALARDAAKKDTEEKEASPEMKRKRELSLTPPPDMPTRRPVPTTAYRAVIPQPAQQTYDLLDDDDDVEELDPDLISIAAKVTTESQIIQLYRPCQSDALNSSLVSSYPIDTH